MCEPPPQLQAAVDDCEIADPLPRCARLTLETEEISLNRYLREAGERLLRRLRPAFVYQRHDAFITSGIDLALRHEIPLVLEWNSSAAWKRRHWGTKQYRFKHVFDRFLVAVEEESLKRSVLIRAVSSRAAEMAVECGAAPDRVVSIPNAVDIDAIPAPTQVTDHNGPPLVGWVGSFGPWHGASVLIQALAQLGDVRAVLVGEGAERDGCMVLARDLGVEERIEWTGALPHREAIMRMSACDVLASPHVPSEGRAFFGSPTKLFEFMAMGRPIVASALEQLDDILDDGRTARLVRPGDATDLARGVREVLTSPDRGQSLGIAARSEAVTQHTWDHRAEELIERLCMSQ
jgi:glycosyltransferase involved in cell wall biosynthesis